MAVITIPVLRPQVGTIRPGTFKHEPAGRRENIELIEEEISFPEEEIRTRLWASSRTPSSPSWT